ncbi:MAG: response regulator transcription factor [Lentisphaeria bacterium]|nr:response regulator transcription factor [Lentisphaeria bacterium]
MSHILIAEDDTNIREGLVDTLELEGYKITSCSNGKEALEKLKEKDFDLVLLDVMMPELNGFDVCKEFRQTNDQTPVIFLTAKGEEIDKVLGLEFGADDYMTKPFGIRELVARIKAALRRCQTQTSQNIDAQATFQFGEATIYRRKYQGEHKGVNFELSSKEMELLKTFYQHPEETLSRHDLLMMVWENEYGDYSRTLDQYIAKIRKKISADTIKTVHGVGYRYEPTK